MRKIMIMLMSLGLVFGGLLLPFYEASATSINSEGIENGTYSDDELQQIQNIEEELEFYFEEVGELTDNGYVITDYDKIQERIDNGDESAERILELASLGENENQGMITPYSADAFAKCVVNKFVSSYGNIARAWNNGLVYTYIKTKQYDLAAQLMAKTLIKAGFKVNAASLAIEAAVYGWQCRGKW